MTYLDEVDARHDLQRLGVRFGRWAAAEHVADIRASADEIGYPVVLKAGVPGISHKSDLGLVEVGIGDADLLADAVERLVERTDAVAERDAVTWIIEELAIAERELLVGVRRDPVFGPLLVVGMGGTEVEVHDDVAMRVLPVDREEIRRMLTELRGYPLLAGHRDRCPVDLDAVASTALALASFLDERPHVTAVEINPLMVRCEGEGAVAVDARVTVVRP